MATFNSVDELKSACMEKVRQVAETHKQKKGTNPKLPDKITDDVIVSAVGNYYNQRWHNYNSNQGRREQVRKIIEAAKAQGIDLSSLGIDEDAA